MLSHPNLRQYIEDGFYHVEGWCHNNLPYVLEWLDALPCNRGGGICEIGVHHGQFFMALNALTELEDRSFAVDVFEDQELNIDKSGGGSSEIFKSHLARYDRHQGHNTVVVRADSTDPAAQADLRERIGLGKVRFFSIDGGHSARHTVNDLELACQLTKNAGVVFVDDFLSSHWLGVMEGTMAYLSRAPTLIPFAVGLNKMLLCRLSFYDTYFKALAASRFNVKVVLFMGNPLIAL